MNHLHINNIYDFHLKFQYILFQFSKMKKPYLIKNECVDNLKNCLEFGVE
jgi:hypothetical protein